MKVLVVVGGQFGSEAKGHVSAQLARRELNQGNKVYAIRVAGHNAGHTAYDNQGRKFALRTIPVMAVVDPDIELILGPGSEIDPRVLIQEAELLEAAGHPVWGRLYIDNQATVLEQAHIDEETDQTMHNRLGSTGKGVGAARADRIMRRAQTWEEFANSDGGWFSQDNKSYHVPGHDTAVRLREHARANLFSTVIVEGTQGYGLGLHAGFYPYCTSSDCRTIDFLGMAGIDPRAAWIEVCDTWIVFRTYPIRVAGNSGPLFREVEWEWLAEQSGGHIQPERTTVTQKIRRIGEWDEKLFEDAMEANGGYSSCWIALTFADYIDPSVFEKEELSEAVYEWMQEHLPRRATVGMVTTGPKTAVWL